MATLSLNTADAIEFKNIVANTAVKDAPTFLAQVGDWEVGANIDTGIVVDSYGTDDHPLILTANDARKLAKWLTRAADSLDNSAAQPKKKKRQHYEEDEQEYDFRN